MRKILFDENQKHVEITHNDLDGHGCKAVLEEAFPNRTSVFMVNNNNVSSTILNILKQEKYKNHVLWITDVSPEKEREGEVIEAIQSEIKNGRKVIMFDHHKTAMHLNQYEWADIIQVYEGGRKTAATSLLYDYLREMKVVDDSLFLKTYVENVRLYDTWEWEEKGILEAKLLNDLYYMYGIDRFDKSLKEKSNNNKNKPFYFDEKEQIVLEMEQKKIANEIESKSRKIVPITVDDLFLGVVFAENYISELGHELSKKFPYLDAVAIVNMSNKKISLRTTKNDIDVSKLALKFNGGGHPPAAGCPLNRTTFEIFVNQVIELPYIKMDVQNKFNNKENCETYYNTCEGNVIIIKQKENVYVLKSDVIDKICFPSFEEAECYIKKHYKAELMKDEEYIPLISEEIGVKESHLRSHFKELIC